MNSAQVIKPLNQYKASIRSAFQRTATDRGASQRSHTHSKPKVPAHKVKNKPDQIKSMNASVTEKQLRPEQDMAGYKYDAPA